MFMFIRRQLVESAGTTSNSAAVDSCDLSSTRQSGNSAEKGSMIENKKDLSKEMVEEKTFPEEPQGDAAETMDSGGANGHITAQSTAVSASENTSTSASILVNGHHQSDDCEGQGTEALKGDPSRVGNYDGERNGEVSQHAGHRNHANEDSGGEMSPTSVDSGVISPSSTPDVMTPVFEASQQTLSGTDEQGKDNSATFDDSGKQLVARTAPLTADGTEEVVLIQDTSFNIKIVAPGCDPFDLQVSSMELVQEIHQVLMDREDTCFRTCFSLQLDGVALDHFTELKNVEGLKDGAVLKVVEEPYTVREARIHLRHVRDLLKSLDPTDAYNGADCSSLSFLNTITNGNALERKRFKLESSVDCTPPESIMPNSKDRPLGSMMPVAKDASSTPCLKVLSLSGWNPPPGNRKLHGDLLYLYVLTIEDKRYHITCCTKGFYVNLSTEEEFSPKPANPKVMFHSLPELLNQLSPGFKKNFTLIQKKRCQRHPFERVATPYQVYSWAVPTFDHTSDAIRAEDAFAFKLGYEEHIPGQTREWNEELQTTRELPRKTLPERLLRERAIFKVHSDFVAAATRGAAAVIDGNVMAINPGEDPKMQMYIWNNIFFSLGFDVKDHYKDFGGDAAAFVAPSSDLLGVKAYFNLDLEGLYVLGTVIIDYRGYRVTAQSIIPGILERDQEQSVVYGSIDFGKTVVTSEKYEELMEKAAQQLKILPHRVISANGDVVKLYSSIESKGIVGNDSRHYILDLLRTFPPDVHYLGADSEVTDVSRENGYPREHPHKFACLRQELIDAFAESRYVTFIKIAAFHLQKLRLKKPKKEKEEQSSEPQAAKEETSNEDSTQATVSADETQKSETAILENGLTRSATDGGIEHFDPSPTGGVKVDIFGALADGNQTVLTAEESEQRQHAVDDLKRKISRGLSPNKDGDLPPTDEAKKIMESFTEEKSSSMEEETKEIIRKAAQAVGSLSDTEYDIRFNPDCVSPAVTHAPEEQLEKQRQLVKEAAQFLLVSQIPNFIRDSLDHTFAPLDGSSLTDALHSRGINIRYLGKLTTFIESLPTLQYLKVICICELICRSAKHIFRSYLQSVEHCWLSAAVAHFLNCFLGSYPTPQPSINDELLSRKKSKKKKNSTSSATQDSTEWAQFSAKSLWQQICKDVDSYYGYQLTADSIDNLCESIGMQKVSVLRRFCIMCGVQILLKDYAFDSKTKAAFAEEDIVNLFPVVKHINPRASDAYNFYTTGQAKIQQGQLRAGYDLVAEALNLLNNVYGAMHPEIAQCLRLLARLAYILGDHQEALANQHKAVLMSERCNGIDHPQTILEYTHLALYCFANLQVSTALKLLYRARYLLLVAHGEDHPHMALLDSNIGLILHAVSEYDLSLRFLEHALKLHILYYGRSSLKTALSYHLIARAQSCRGDFRTALQYEKETFTIYKNALGEEHEKTRESSECLKHLTQQAVTFQKRMNEITRNAGSVSQLLPLQIQQPSLSSVLDVLNVISGIVFIQISPKEVEALRAELDKTEESGGNAMITELPTEDSRPTSMEITELSSLD